MPFNGSGVFNRIYNWVNDKANSIPVTASRMDAEMDGMATGLSTCLTKDGQTTPTANIKLGGFKLTGLGNPTTSGDALAWGGPGNLTTLTTTGTLTASGGVTGAVTGNASTATALATPRAIGIGGTTGLTATGVNFDGTAAINPALTGTLVIGNGGTGQTTAAGAFGALKQDATTSATGVVELATNAEVKTGTDTSRVAPVSAMSSHLGMAKAWFSGSVSGSVLTVNASYNCSVVRNTTGDFTVTITSPLADNFPAVAAIVQRPSTDDNIIIAVKTGGTVNSNTIPLRVVAGGSNTAIDPSFISVIIFGN